MALRLQSFYQVRYEQLHCGYKSFLNFCINFTIPLINKANFKLCACSISFPNFEIPKTISTFIGHKFASSFLVTIVGVLLLRILCVSFKL